MRERVGDNRGGRRETYAGGRDGGGGQLSHLEGAVAGAVKVALSTAYKGSVALRGTALALIGAVVALVALFGTLGRLTGGRGQGASAPEGRRLPRSYSGARGARGAPPTQRQAHATRRGEGRGLSNCGRAEGSAPTSWLGADSFGARLGPVDGLRGAGAGEALGAEEVYVGEPSRVGGHHVAVPGRKHRRVVPRLRVMEGGAPSVRREVPGR